MAEGARVESIDAIKAFKLALIKFSSSARSAMADVESDLNRTLIWLDTEQKSYWEHQIRKRQTELARAHDQLRQKTLFKDATGSRRDTAEEVKAVKRWEAAVQEANEKLVAVRRSSARLQKESTLYKGKVQRLYNAVESDIPVATAKLDKMVESLEAYVQLALTDDNPARMAQVEPTATTPVQDTDEKK